MLIAKETTLASNSEIFSWWLNNSPLLDVKHCNDVVSERRWYCNRSAGLHQWLHVRSNKLRWCLVFIFTNLNGRETEEKWTWPSCHQLQKNCQKCCKLHHRYAFKREFQTNRSCQSLGHFSQFSKTLTQSGRTIIAQPAGQSIQETARLHMRIAGAKIKGVIILFERGEKSKSEFSFRLTGNDLNEHIFMVAPKLVSIMSRSPSIFFSIPDHIFRSGANKRSNSDSQWQ